MQKILEKLESDYERFNYICSLSDEDKIKSIDYLDSDRLRALILASLANDSDKVFLLDKLNTPFTKALVISSFKSDQDKIPLLNMLSKNAKPIVVASFKTNDLKKEYFHLAKTDQDKALIINSFTYDQYKLWGIEQMAKVENKIPLIGKLEYVDNMVTALNEIEDYAVKLDIIYNLSEKQKMLLVLKLDGKLQAEVLASIKDISFKLSFLDKLSSSNKMIVCLKLPDTLKVRLLDTDLDYLDKMALVYSLQDITLREEWIAKLQKPMAFDLGIDPTIPFGLEIECEGSFFAYLCNLWNSKKGYRGTIDSSLKNGVEVKTPILYNTPSFLEQLYYVFNAIQKAGMECSSRCGGHIHFDQGYLKTKREYMALFEIWSYTEKIFYLIANEAGNVPRENIGRFALPFLDSIVSSLRNDVVYQDMQKSDDDFIFSLSSWQLTKSNSLNFHHKDKKLHTMEFRVANGSVSFITWMQNVKLFGRLLMISKALGNIQLEQAGEDEMNLWNLKEQLKQDISLEEKLEILLELLFSENEKEVYRNRYYVNSKLLAENDFLDKYQFLGIDMNRILKK